MAQTMKYLGRPDYSTPLGTLHSGTECADLCTQVILVFTECLEKLHTVWHRLNSKRQPEKREAQNTRSPVKGWTRRAPTIHVDAGPGVRTVTGVPAVVARPAPAPSSSSLPVSALGLTLAVTLVLTLGLAPLGPATAAPLAHAPVGTVRGRPPATTATFLRTITSTCADPAQACHGPSQHLNRPRSAMSCNVPKQMPSRPL